MNATATDRQLEGTTMTDDTEMETPTLVVGGTGKTGRRIAERLTARGVPGRIGSRSADPPFDWENPATWAPALDDVRAVFVSYQPDLAVPGALDVVRSFAELALGHGVRRLVLISGRGEEGPSAPNGRCRRPVATSPSCARRGSGRTSARTTCSTTCSAGWSPFPPGTRPSHSPTPTTSPMSPRRRSPTTGTSARPTS
jgi:hypothetical protein